MSTATTFILQARSVRIKVGFCLGDWGSSKCRELAKSLRLSTSLLVLSDEEGEDPADQHDAFCHIEEARSATIIWMPEVPQLTARAVGVVGHELHHALAHSLKYQGFEDEELFASLQGHFEEEFWKMLGY